MSKKAKSKSKRIKMFNIDKYVKKFFPRDVATPSNNLEAQYIRVSGERPTRVSSTHFEHPSHWIRIAA